MYPWPGFGDFQFFPSQGETALPGTDTGWTRSPSVSRTRPLGSSTDLMVLMANGSYERTFELLLSPARLAALQAVQNTKGSFVDWTRPVPDNRAAYLYEINPTEEVYAACPDETDRTLRRWRTRITLVSA